MESAPPIFILSCERSGSTLLRYILDTHPEICSPGELFLGRLAKDLGETVSRTLGLTAGEKEENRNRATWREVNRVIGDLMSNYARSRGKKIWCDKTPFNLKNLPELGEAFPDARYLCLYRDGLDVVYSGLNLAEKSYIWWALPYVVKHPQNYAAALLENWVDKTRILLNFQKDNPRSHRVRYEDLVVDPQKTLDEVFRFLGLGWDPSMLDRVFEVNHDLGGGDYKITLTDKIEKDRIGKGSEIDPKLLAVTPSELLEKQKELHSLLGYPLPRVFGPTQNKHF